MANQASVATAVAFIEVTAAVAEFIRKAGPIPNGELWAMVMPQIRSFENYQTVIRTLKGAELVAEENHVLRWVGPEILG